MRMLVIDDDMETRAYVSAGLREIGYVVEEAATGTLGLDMAMEGAFDALIVDRMLPGCSGLDLIRTLRAEGRATPVLMLTSLGSVAERVEGLNAGADDYLVKPFAFSELLARVQALGRRPPLALETERYRVADLEIDLRARTVRRGDTAIDLTAHEFRLLEQLARNAGLVVTRVMLLETLWGFHFDPRPNIIDAHISRLRAKMDRGFDRELLHTVRGVGYVLRA